MRSFKKYFDDTKYPDVIAVLWETDGNSFGRIFHRVKDDKYDISYIVNDPDNTGLRWTKVKLDDYHTLWSYNLIRRSYKGDKFKPMSSEEFEEWFTLENI